MAAVVTSAAAAAGAGAGTPAGARAAARGVYSFCMCPGGQIVPTSTSPGELCLNGMSFSRRQSLWANSALVATVGPADWAHLAPAHGALAGVELQRQFERAAAAAGAGRWPLGSRGPGAGAGGGGSSSGGAGLVAPVQRGVDFMSEVESRAPLPPSSYRCWL